MPAGAIPKDGPSAGITMTTALVSLLTDRPVNETVGMTGEITLQGAVLPIGGVKQKVLAAHRAGLTQVVLPKRNGPDIDDVPEKVREQMTFHLADTYADVAKVAFRLRQPLTEAFPVNAPRPRPGWIDWEWPKAAAGTDRRRGRQTPRLVQRSRDLAVGARRS